jgi:hypothetical protein
MPTTNPYPLNIPAKVNSPELLAWFQQFGIDKYLSAEEINKMSAALQFLYENLGGGALSQSGITTLGTITIVDDEVNFEDFAWKIDGVDYELDAPITRVLPLAAEGMYRTHTAYLTTDNDILIAEGPEDSEVTTEPSIPTGTLRLRAFNVFGEVITAGPGESLPYDINLLDELLSLPEDPDYFLINKEGVDYRIKRYFLTFFDKLRMKTNSSYVPSLVSGYTDFYMLNNRLCAYFTSSHIQIEGNTEAGSSSVLKMPFAAGTAEINRPVSNITTSLTLAATHNSRTVRVSPIAASPVDITIPNPLSGDYLFNIVNESDVVVKLIPSGYLINGVAEPFIVLEKNVNYWVKRVATNNWILSPKSGATTVPSATDSLAGIMKLYNSFGINTDGSIRQDFFTSTINKIENFFISKQNGTFGSHTGDLLETVLSSDDVVGGFFVAGDTMLILISGEKSAAVANVTYRIRFGTTGTTSDELIATYTGNNRGLNMQRVNISFLSGNLVRVITPTTPLISDVLGTSAVFSNVSLTYSSAFKITITAQLGNATETASIRTLRASKIKSIT